MKLNIFEGRENLWFAIALVYLVAIGSLDVTIRTESFIGVTILAPLVVSATNSTRRTILTSVLWAVFGYTSLVTSSDFGKVLPIVRAGLFTFGNLFLIAVAYARVQREQAFRQVSRVAEVAQLAILHPIPHKVGPVSFSVRYLSAAEEASIGGDFYEVISTPYGVRAIVGDVRGKGLEAVRLAAVMLGAFREAATVQEKFEEVGVGIDRSLQEFLGPEDFVTAVMIQFNGRDVKVVNCGHHPPLRVCGSSREFLDGAAPTPPFGLSPTFNVSSSRLDDGDRILLYTDGLIEARSPSGDFLTLDEMESALQGPDIDLALDELIDEAMRHTGGDLNDDLALVLAEIHD